MIAPLVRELREMAPLLALAGLTQLFLLACATGLVPKSIDVVGPPSGIPFYDPIGNGDVRLAMIYVGGALAIALGLWQTGSELVRGTFHFLLHRPPGRLRVFGAKLAVGATACLLTTVVPLFGYALWAATPGTHPSPFFWSMTAKAWQLCLGVLLAYLATFLSGLRPARWYGSRFLPLPIVAMVVLFLYLVPVSWLITMIASLVVCGCYLLVILYVGCTRDFS